MRVFCWTGARIGAFFNDGLHYRDIELVLQRTTDDKWKCIYKPDQRWVKNNRDPENIVFGTALQEQDKFKYDDAAFLLAMAIADKGLFSFSTLACDSGVTESNIHSQAQECHQHDQYANNADAEY